MTSGTVFNIGRYAIHDGPGIRTTVFLKGCPLGCWWCHNPESLSPRPEIAIRPTRCIRCGTCVDRCPRGAISLGEDGCATDPGLCQLCGDCAASCPADAREVVGRTLSVAEVLEEVVKDTPFYDESGGGVTFSGGEPLMQPAFLAEILDACGRLDIHRTVDTCGHVATATLLEIARRTELFLYDLKHMDREIHRKYTGVGNERILENLKALSSRGAAVRVRFPVIPGINDDRINLERAAVFLRSLPRPCAIDLLPHHDVAISKYGRFGYQDRLGRLPAPDPARLREIAATLRGHGLDVTLGGPEHERAHPQAPPGQP